MKSFEELLEESVALHGHKCAGQVLGVRMAMIGCREVGVEEPKVSKDLIVYLEIDRCAADAIQSVTGCSLGRRTLKYVDYGKMAATFLNNMVTGKAVRVVARDDSREKAPHYARGEFDRRSAQIRAYMVMPERELFTLSEVLVDVPEEDLPGSPVSRVPCARCGEGINDRREVIVDGQTLCRACAHGAYYQPSSGRREPTPEQSVDHGQT